MKSIKDMPGMFDGDEYEGPFAGDPSVPKLAPSLVLGRNWLKGRNRDVVEGKIVGHYAEDGKTLLQKPAHISQDGWEFYLRQLDRDNPLTPEEAARILTERWVSDLNWDIREIFKKEMRAEQKRQDWSDYVRNMPGTVPVTDALRAEFAAADKAYRAVMPMRVERERRARAADERHVEINNKVMSFLGVMILPVILFGLICGIVSFSTGSLTAFWLMIGSVAVLAAMLFGGG